MPIYDYKCRSCDTELNSQLFKVDHEAPYCPVCGTVMAKNYPSMRVNLRGLNLNDSIDLDLTGEPIVYHSLRGLKDKAKEHGCILRDTVL